LELHSPLAVQLSPKAFVPVAPASTPLSVVGPPSGEPVDVVVGDGVPVDVGAGRLPSSFPPSLATLSSVEQAVR
jgi:hypothetical protein